MRMFIGIESVAANALIERVKAGKRYVDFKTIVNYGTKVARLLQKETNKEPILLLYKDYQLAMLENYSSFFEVESKGPGLDVFWLKEGKTSEDLENTFRWNLSVKLIKAYMSEEAIKELGVSV